MKFLAVDVDSDLQERFTFRDSSFPLGICHDEYNLFIGGTVNCHWHDAFEYGIVLSGTVDYYINDTHMRLSQGDCVFVNVNSMHMSRQCTDSEGAVMAAIVFPSALFAGDVGGTIYSRYFRPIINSSLQGFQIQSTADGNIIREVLLEISGLDPSAYGYELHCMSLLTKLWYATNLYIANADIGLLEHTFDRRQEQRAKQMLSYVHRHYAENITVQDIAHSAGISRSECFRCFKRVTNKKPVEYINEYRLTQASRLISETDRSITEICSSCGFSSSSYFGKLFKDTFGVSPARFRRDSCGCTA